MEKGNGTAWGLQLIGVKQCPKPTRPTGPPPKFNKFSYHDLNERSAIPGFGQSLAPCAAFAQPLPMNPTHSLLRTHLRQRVADTFGTALTYLREAEALAAVLLRTGERLSPSNLKRFLGLLAAVVLPAAYAALLADGILLEERGLNAFEELTVYVRFGHENLLEYLVAR